MIEVLLASWLAVKYDRFCLYGITLYEHSILISCSASMNFILMKRESNSHEIFFFQFRLAHLCKIMEINVYLYECMHA